MLNDSFDKLNRQQFKWRYKNYKIINKSNFQSINSLKNIKYVNSQFLLFNY